MAASHKVKIGLLQTWADADPVSNLKRTLQLAHAAADRGAKIISTQELFRSEYFCQSEDHAHFALAEEIPNGPSTQAFMELAKSRGVVIVASLFEKRAAGVYHNTAAIIDADGTYLGKYRKMHIPRRPALLREVLLHAGRPRLPLVGHQVRQDRRPRLLGPVVSRGRAPHRHVRRADSFLPDRHWLASQRAREVRRSAPFLVGNDPARACRGQRLLRRGDQSHRPREADRRRRHQVLGPELHRQHQRPDHRQGRRRE